MPICVAAISVFCVFIFCVKNIEFASHINKITIASKLELDFFYMGFDLPNSPGFF